MPLTDDVPVKRKVNRQAEASANRREQILDAAVSAFTEHGFNGATIRDIAVRAGISHTGLLHHFPDKNALLEAVLDRRLDRGMSDTVLDPSDGVALLRALVDLAAHDMEDPDDLRMYRILSSEALAPGHPAYGYFRRWYEQVREWARLALEDLRRRGLYARPELDVATAAVQIAGMRDGLDPQWLLDPGAIDLVGTVRAQLQMYSTVDLLEPVVATPDAD